MSVDFKGRERSVERIERFKDGGVRARGHTIDGALTGYWEWYRKDGTKLRSGYFEAGAPVDEWTTYDANGEVYKVTAMRAPKKLEVNPSAPPPTKGRR